MPKSAGRAARRVRAARRRGPDRPRTEHSGWPPERARGGAGRTRSWRRPMFPKGCPLSIFGAGELDFRVRDGNGYGLSARVTRILLLDVIGCDLSLNG